MDNIKESDHASKEDMAKNSVHNSHPIARNMLSIDFGGTYIKAGIVRDEGSGLEIKSFKTAPTEKDKGHETVMSNLKSVIDSLIAELPQEDSIGRIGVGIPGNLKEENVMFENKLGLREKELYAFLTENYCKDVRFINDANAFALAEANLGAGKDYRVVFGITLGTGFGSGLCIDKRIYRGRLNAVESYHFPVEYDGLVHRGDDMLSEKGLVMIARDNGVLVQTAKDLYDMPEEKTKVIFEAFGKLLANAMFNLTLLFDPDIFVIGGGVANSYARFRDVLDYELKRKKLPSVPKIAIAKVRHPGLIGALLH